MSWIRLAQDKGYWLDCVNQGSEHSGSIKNWEVVWVAAQVAASQIRAPLHAVLLCTYGAGVEPSPLLLRPLIGLLYYPWLTGGDDCGVISGMNEFQGNYLEKSYPTAALFITISNNTTWNRTRTVAVGNRQLPAWATTRPKAPWRGCSQMACMPLLHRCARP
jgi:hypothetical protein